MNLNTKLKDEIRTERLKLVSLIGLYNACAKSDAANAVYKTNT